MCNSVVDADWFDPNNEEAMALRAKVNATVTMEIIAFLQQHENGIAIMDSTNPTHERREGLLKNVLKLTVANDYISI